MRTIVRGYLSTTSHGMAARGKGQWVTLLCFACGVVLHTDVAMGEISKGCFGSAGACLDHILTCSATSRVAILKALYGHKMEQHCTPGVISCSDLCCVYLPLSDCFRTFTAEHVSETYQNCTDHSCHFRTPRLVQNCQISTTVYQAVSSYSVVEYECVEDSTIVPMCGAVASVSGRSVSILYDPKKQYMEATDACWCSLWQASQNEIHVEAIDVRLNGSSGGCGSFHIYGFSGSFLHHCYSPPVWPSLTLTRRYDYYSTIKLTGLSEFVWVRFSAANTLYVTCSLNNQHTTTTTLTTTTTTSTTATTTTTTMTYPTASLPGVITKSPATVASETSTTSAEATKTSTTSAEATKTSASSDTSTGSTEIGTSSDTSAGSTKTNTSLHATTLPTKSSSGQRTGDDGTVGAAVGVGVGAVILVILIVVLVVWCRRIQKEKKPKRGRESALYKDASALSKTNPAFTNATYNGIKTPVEKPTATPGTTVVPMGSVISKPVIPPTAPTTKSVIPPPAPTTTSVIPPTAPTTKSVIPPPAPSTTSVIPPTTSTTSVIQPKAPITTSSVIPPTTTTTSVIQPKAPITTSSVIPPTTSTTSVIQPKAPTTTSSVIPPTTTTTSVIPSIVSTTPAVKPTTLNTIPETKNVKSPVYDTLKAKGEEHPYSEIKPSTTSVKAPGVVGASNTKSSNPATEMIRM